MASLPPPRLRLCLSPPLPTMVTCLSAARCPDLHCLRWEVQVFSRFALISTVNNYLELTAQTTACQVLSVADFNFEASILSATDTKELKKITLRIVKLM